MIGYGFMKKSNKSFELVVNDVKENLKKEGFGILSTIDIQEKFKEKLGIDFKKYIILGACHPASAHKAIEAEENIGLMLPCNVIIYEKDNQVIVSAIKPTAAMGMLNNPTLNQIAEDIEAKLKHVIDDIQ